MRPDSTCPLSPLSLHDALPIFQRESQTLASTTFQNYFRFYPVLAGMTGIADTEAFEFREIYKLDVVAVPTNRPAQRIDLNDQVFMTVAEKYDRSEEHTSELQSRGHLVCRLLLEKKK